MQVSNQIMREINWWGDVSRGEGEPGEAAGVEVWMPTNGELLRFRSQSWEHHCFAAGLVLKAVAVHECTSGFPWKRLSRDIGDRAGSHVGARNSMGGVTHGGARQRLWTGTFYLNRTPSPAWQRPVNAAVGRCCHGNTAACVLQSFH